jgi:signal transduction histidine kinase
VVTITTGTLVGCLVGSAVSLRDQHLEVGDLSQRNAVLNRVLRHNIKNDMNVIIGHASLLGEEIDGETTGSVEAIHRAASDVTRLSEAARTIDKLGTAPDSCDVDLARFVRQSVDSADSFYPEATIEADLPSTAWVEASPLVGTVVANLLKNAIEHNTDEATVEVSVEVPDGDGDEPVALTVADDGPGIYEDERAVLEAGEDPITHGSGMGLWLVKWFAQAYDGDLRFEDNEPQGTVVHLTLPTADGTAEDCEPVRGTPASATLTHSRW